jgi:hypothetical protein
VVDRLIGHGADPNLRIGAEGPFSTATNALNCAAELSKCDALNAWLECGADVNAAVNGPSALKIAAGHGNVEVLMHVIHRGADRWIAPVRLPPCLYSRAKRDGSSAHI